MEMFDVVNGRYTIIQKIGSGGNSQVWLANDKIGNQEVAIKFLSYDMNDTKKMNMFEQEAMTMAAIHNEHICQIKDYGKWQDQAFIVMESIKGRSLKEVILAKGYCLIDEFNFYMSQILDGMSAVHSKNIIHRDIKPENFMLTSDGIIKIIDFGTALISDEDFNKYEENSDSGITGTIQYMSPEHFSNALGTRQTDIYAIGISMFYLLTEKLPFNSDLEGKEKYRSIIAQHKTKPLPSIRKYNKDIPEEYEKIIIKACAKTVEERYKSVEELKADLLVAYQNYKNPKKKKQRFFAKLFGRK